MKAKISILLASVFSVVILMSFAYIQQPKPWKAPDNFVSMKNPSKATAQEGKKLYDKNKCNTCHGAKMNKKVSATFNTDTEGSMFYKTKEGNTSLKMPAYKDKMTDNEIWAVVVYMKSK